MTKCPVPIPDCQIRLTANLQLAVRLECMSQHSLFTSDWLSVHHQQLWHLSSEVTQVRKFFSSQKAYSRSQACRQCVDKLWASHPPVPAHTHLFRKALPKALSFRKGFLGSTTRAFPGMMPSTSPCITAMKESVVGSGPIRMPGKSCSSRYLDREVEPHCRGASRLTLSSTPKVSEVAVRTGAEQGGGRVTTGSQRESRHFSGPGQLYALQTGCLSSSPSTSGKEA